MSEGNHAAVDDRQDQPKNNRTLKVVAGTATAVLLAGLAFQLFRNSQSGTAAERPGTVGTAQVAGTGRPIESAAKITRAGRSIQVPLSQVAEECMRRIGNDVLDSMINRAIIQLACEEAGVTVTEPEVEQEIVRIAKQFNIPVETWLQMLSSERNITPKQYSTDVIWPMLALKKLAGDKVAINDKDMYEAFERNYGRRVKCHMIMLDNVRRANDVWHEARLKPAEFERVARDHSIDTNSRALGGSIPPIARFTGSPTLEKAAFSLKEGEISGVIQLGTDRFVILKCDGFTEQVVTKIDEVKAYLHAELVEQKVQEAVATLFEGLKETTRVDNYWTQTTTGDVKQVSGQTAPSSAVRQAGGTSQPALRR